MDFDKSSFLDNSIDSVMLRKSENNLVILGMGIMIFGLWNVAKTISVLFLNRNSLIDAVRKGMPEPPDAAADTFIFVLTVIIIIILLSVGIIFRLYIGLSAISVGKDHKNRTLYIPITILYILASLFSIYYDVSYYFFTAEADKTFSFEISESPTVSVIIEITSLIMLIELIVYSVRIRKIRRSLITNDSSDTVSNH